MGRRKEPEALQAAKGSPGRRMTKAQRRQLKARELADLLVSGEAAAPGIFEQPEYAPAKAIWEDLGPELKRTGRLQPAHAMSFAMFCGYVAEFWMYDRDIKENTGVQRVKTTVGGSMERLRPAVRLREIAMTRALELGDRFGLTPTEEYKLFKDQQIVRRENPGLFGETAGPASPASAEPAAQLELDAVGGMKGLRSEPPTLQ